MWHYGLGRTACILVYTAYLAVKASYYHFEKTTKQNGLLIDNWKKKLFCHEFDCILKKKKISTIQNAFAYSSMLIKRIRVWVE